MPKVIYILPNGERRELEAHVGQNLMKLAVDNGLDIEGACGGVMACSTCHLIVDKDWYGKLPPASDDEMDMLDLAPGITKISRLGCQIKMTDALNGLTVKLPPTAKNMLG